MANAVSQAITPCHADELPRQSLTGIELDVLLRHLEIMRRHCTQVASATQEEATRRTISDKRPEQPRMGFLLWSCAAVGRLLEH